MAHEIGARRTSKVTDFAPLTTSMQPNRCMAHLPCYGDEPVSTDKLARQAVSRY